MMRLKARTRRNGVKPGYNAIAAELNQEGHSTRHGKRWRAQTVKNVLLRTSKGSEPKAYTKKAQLLQEDYLTPQQVVDYAGRLTGELRLLFCVMVGTGLRASELCALQVRDVAVGMGRREITVRRGKGNKARTVFIDREVAAMLMSHVAGRPKRAAVFVNKYGGAMSYWALRRRVIEMRKTLGDDSLHAHGFRHTFATILYHNEKDLKAVRDQLGHSSIATTDIYAKSLPDEKLRQMQVFSDLIKQDRGSPEAPNSTSKVAQCP